MSPEVPTIEATTNSATHRFVQGLALCILIAGSLDILDAIIFYGIRGVRATAILKHIASGLLGPSAIHGGNATAAIGLGIHYTITACWSALYLLLASRVKILSRHPVFSGLTYGIVIYCLMNFVVLPLTYIKSSGHASVASLVNGVLALMLFMGLPIAWIASRFLNPAHR